MEPCKSLENYSFYSRRKRFKAREEKPQGQSQENPLGTNLPANEENIECRAGLRDPAGHQRVLAAQLRQGRPQHGVRAALPEVELHRRQRRHHGHPAGRQGRGLEQVGQNVVRTQTW